MSSQDPDKYLSVLKASYDYQPQSDDEIAIKEDQLLLLVEKVDEDWWKVKVKGSTQDVDSALGLVPAAYVEQAPHTSVVKVLYDYDAAAPGEVTVHEDDVLYVFDTEDDWILVQDSKTDKAGYVPGNYVEVVDQDAGASTATSRIIVPDSPPRPSAPYVDPAERVAAAKATSDGIETWSVSELDKKGKKKKGTLGVGNGAVFFASESDKTPVQKWQTKDVTSMSSEKAKHVRIDIGGANPASLHFHAGSKEIADAIISKLEASKALSSSPSEEFAGRYSADDAPDPEPVLQPAREVPKKASVHFSPASPVIIPPAKEQGSDDEEYEASGESATALYDFSADGEDELSVKEGEKLIVLEKDGEEWWKCRNATGREGVVPASYLELIGSAKADSPTTTRNKADEGRRQAEEAAEADRLQREEEEAAERSRRQQEATAAARKAEAQRKAKEASLAAEAERQKRKEAAAARVATPPKSPPPISRPAEAPRQSSDVSRPPVDQTRIWHDRSGQFRVEAAFLGFKDGKLRLHKVNGVIVEVPSEKMSVDDMRYVEKLLDKNKKRPSSAPRVSDDDIPLALSKPTTSSQKPPQPSKKGPRIDWFDFFLSAGCDLDDCTRYAAAFEKDKLDENLLNDITEGTMRSLGLREGDIIRVKKSIEKRRPTDNMQKPSVHLQEQMRRDEELARQLQAQENSGSTRAPAPNLFAGPGGVLKAPRRGRPQPSKSLPPAGVDLDSISSASGQIQRVSSPNNGHAPASAATSPPRASSTAPVINGFDDDAWTNRPSSTKPVKSESPAPAPRPPSEPPAAIQQQATAHPPQPAPAIVPPSQPTTTTQSPPPHPQATPSSTSNLAKTTEADIFEQLARLSDLRKSQTPSAPPTAQQPAVSPIPVIQPSASYHAGLGMGSSSIPMGQLSNAHMLSPPSQAYNGPRGPFAPVPANQGLLQPLIPTQTGFSGFVPTKSINTVPSPFQNQIPPPSFMTPQQTGFQRSIIAQPTGAVGNFGNGLSPFQGNMGPFNPIQSQPTGFNPGMVQSPFGGGPTPPVPPLPANLPSNATTPANVFASMKSGTFATESDSNNTGLNGQNPAWGQSYQGYTGY